jgi:hypothetical protein
MGKLIYSMITSLDGYVSDKDGNFGWGAPDEELHEFVGELSRGIGTYLYGRGKPHTPTRTSRRTSRTTPGSGRRPTRSSTRRR